ncbi:MAG: hypothetical protein MUP97_05275 [Acidimicrobiia bacterium]|nr:hypothetical protein [Acidimicrobiia bacterium]
MANSRKKYTRARIRAHGRRPKKRGGAQWFYGALAAIVVLGVVGVVLARPDSSSAGVPPQPGNPTTGAPGDHWHAALAANVCGEWMAPPATFETAADNANVRVGIHTHGDGFMHVHPFTKSEGGDNATFGKFLGYGGWSASEDSLSLWAAPTGSDTTDWSNGDTCPQGTPFAGKKGVVKYSIDCAEKHDNPSDIKLKDGEVVAVAFLPKSESIGVPPNATAAPANDEGATPKALDAKGCATGGPGATATTTTPAPAATDATTPPSSTP